MENFIAGRLPACAILDELRPYMTDMDWGATPAARAFVDLDRALAAHDAALVRFDQAEQRFIVARTAVGAPDARDGH